MYLQAKRFIWSEQEDKNLNKGELISLFRDLGMWLK